MIHGGFWQSAYDLEHTGNLCAALTREKVVTCNIEYRRLGNKGGGWPGTFLDVRRGADKILELLSSDPKVDSSRVTVMGHSAGGHLALWLVSSHRLPSSSPLNCDERQRIKNAVSLAGVCDLRLAWKQRLGDGVVARLLGGTPDQHTDRYDSANPTDLLPSGARSEAIHGVEDDIVPISQSEGYVEKAKRAGDRARLTRLDGTGHFELIDPESEAWPHVVSVVKSVLGM